MEFHLRDSDMLQKLIDAIKGGNFDSQEHYELVWDGHNFTYDITPSVHTFHLLTKSCNTANLSHLFENWKVMRNIRLTIYHNHDTLTFLPSGIISVHSTRYGDKILHTGNSQEVDCLLEFLQQG